MARGKQTCKILKEIRRQIAEANDIEFVTSECRYKGDCLGTCPKCEAEVRYLELQLHSRSLAGKAVALAGISATALTMLMPMTSQAQSLSNTQNALADSISETRVNALKVKGIVLGENTESDGTIVAEEVIGATVLNLTNRKGTATDIDGKFEIDACVGDTLEVRYVGYETQTIVVTDEMRNMSVTLVPSQGLMGELAVVEIRKPIHCLDLNVFDENGNRIDNESFNVERIWTDEDGEEDSEYIYPFSYDEKHPCRIAWDVGSGLKDDDTGKPLKEATLRITAEGYDDPVIIKVKYPKRNAKKTIKFKHKKK